MTMDAPRPFMAFNFSVEIFPDGASAPLVKAAFAECDGLEMTLDVKTIRCGGAADRAFRVPGFVSYSNLTLKRGMTDNFELWGWFEDAIANPSLRADAEIVLLGEDGSAERARFQLLRCLPARLKAPALNARDGQVAIEELQLAYEKLQLVRPAAKVAA